MDILESIQPVWKVLAVGMLLGAGLPAVFAIGIHFGSARTPPDGSAPVATLRGRIVSWVCFAIIGIAILFGLAVLVAADHVLPAVGLG